MGAGVGGAEIVAVSAEPDGLDDLAGQRYQGGGCR
jgi:hypothetical protein